MRTRIVSLTLMILAALGAPLASRSGNGVQKFDTLNHSTDRPDPAQVEVIEFFWYGCPHCAELEPRVQAWRKTTPAYVHFRRVPVTWNSTTASHARLYFTLAALGRNDLDPAVFSAIHHGGQRLVGSSTAETSSQQQAFVVAHGLAADKFSAVYDSAQVKQALAGAEAIAARYGIDAVPTFVVAGRYRTTVTQAGGQQQLFDVVNELIERVHSSR